MAWRCMAITLVLLQAAIVAALLCHYVAIRRAIVRALRALDKLLEEIRREELK